MANDKQLGPHPEFQWAGKRVVEIEHYGPASYATGGETLTASNYGMKQFSSVEVLGVSVTDPSTIYGQCKALKVQAGPYSTTFKLLWYSDQAGTQTANATDLSAKRVSLRLVGN